MLRRRSGRRVPRLSAAGRRCRGGVEERVRRADDGVVRRREVLRRSDRREGDHRGSRRAAAVHAHRRAGLVRRRPAEGREGVRPRTADRAPGEGDRAEQLLAAERVRRAPGLARRRHELDPRHGLAGRRRRRPGRRDVADVLLARRVAPARLRRHRGDHRRGEGARVGEHHRERVAREVGRDALVDLRARARAVGGVRHRPRDGASLEEREAVDTRRADELDALVEAEGIEKALRGVLEAAVARRQGDILDAVGAAVPARAPLIDGHLERPRERAVRHAVEVALVRELARLAGAERATREGRERHAVRERLAAERGRRVAGLRAVEATGVAAVENHRELRRVTARGCELLAQPLEPDDPVGALAVGLAHVARAEREVPVRHSAVPRVREEPRRSVGRARPRTELLREPAHLRAHLVGGGRADVPGRRSVEVLGERRSRRVAFARAHEDVHILRGDAERAAEPDHRPKVVRGCREVVRAGRVERTVVADANEKCVAPRVLMGGRHGFFQSPVRLRTRRSCRVGTSRNRRSTGKCVPRPRRLNTFRADVRPQRHAGATHEHSAAKFIRCSMGLSCMREHVRWARTECRAASHLPLRAPRRPRAPRARSRVTRSITGRPVHRPERAPQRSAPVCGRHSAMTRRVRIAGFLEDTSQRPPRATVEFPAQNLTNDERPQSS